MIDTLPNLTMHVTNNRVTCVLEILHTTHLTKVFSFSLCANSHVQKSSASLSVQIAMAIGYFIVQVLPKSLPPEKKWNWDRYYCYQRAFLKTENILWTIHISYVTQMLQEWKFFPNNLKLFYNLKTTVELCPARFANIHVWQFC